jgi:hypothetical protein
VTIHTLSIKMLPLVEHWGLSIRTQPKFRWLGIYITFLAGTSTMDSDNPAGRTEGLELCVLPIRGFGAVLVFCGTLLWHQN